VGATWEVALLSDAFHQATNGGEVGDFFSEERSCVAKLMQNFNDAPSQISISHP
jgi:hypothetical protein